MPACKEARWNPGASRNLASGQGGTEAGGSWIMALSEALAGKSVL